MKKDSNLLSKVSIPVAGIVALASLIGFQAYAEESIAFRSIVLFGGVGIAVAIILLSPSGRQFIVFFREAIQEVKRVVWPTKKETLQTVLIVFAFVLVVAIFLWFADKFYEWFLYSIVLGWK
jgi:preprotein translocase subunit SecE